MRELFIYYRVRASDEAKARRIVESFQSQLCVRFPPLVARLLRKAEESEGLHTWMEIYCTSAVMSREGINRELEAAIEAHALALSHLIVGSRHTEVFV